MHNKNIAKKQANEYPYIHINYFYILFYLHKSIYTCGNENDYEPRNFITKYNKTGIPKPKLYTITTPYLTSYNLNIY